MAMNWNTKVFSRGSGGHASPEKLKFCKPQKSFPIFGDFCMEFPDKVHQVLLWLNTGTPSACWTDLFKNHIKYIFGLGYNNNRNCILMLAGAKLALFRSGGGGVGWNYPAKIWELGIFRRLLCEIKQEYTETFERFTRMTTENFQEVLTI